MSVARNHIRRFRMNMVFGMLMLLFAVMLVRLGKLQLVDGAQYAAEADANHQGAYRLAATRGRILDRGGVPLAVPKPARRLGVDPSSVRDPRTFALALSDHLGGELQPWQIRDVLQAAQTWARDRERDLPQYRILMPYVDDPALVSRLDELASLSIRRKRAAGVWGAVVHREEGRSYPNGDYAAHVLGQIPAGPDRPGTGVEEWLDPHLAGRDLEITITRDARRRGDAQTRGGPRPSTAGRDVRLTIDITIQHMLERAMDEMVLEHGPHQAAGVVLDPHSGEILAMASRPTFDPNRKPANANLAIQGLYEPGSFFKPFTVASALGHGVVES
ncbi:MAG: penicillin-binding transpeptidase domain-containing protein, partial [Planctomycetota bacterium]|nr:penicillin-binding transpeptidase domain-containing protein [Planctomycetota bacterium]